MGGQNSEIDPILRRFFQSIVKLREISSNSQKSYQSASVSPCVHSIQTAFSRWRDYSDENFEHVCAVRKIKEDMKHNAVRKVESVGMQGSGRSDSPMRSNKSRPTLTHFNSSRSPHYTGASQRLRLIASASLPFRHGRVHTKAV